MKKRMFPLVLSLVLMLAVLAGCQPSAPNTDDNPPAKANLNIAAIQGPTGIGLANLMQSNADKTSTNNYTFDVLTNPNDVTALLLNGDADIVSVPTNVAAALYNKTSGNIRILALNTGCVLTLMENGNTVNSVADLRGKTIYSTGQGANPEYVLRYLLQKNGLDPDKDVTLEFLTDNQDLGNRMASGSIEVALVPQPIATSVLLKNKNARVALDVATLWENAVTDDSRIMMGCVIAKKDFVENNKAAVDAFLAEYKTSIEKANSDAAATGTLCETYGIIANATMATKAIPSCALTFVSGADMSAKMKGYYDILFSYNAKSVGGAVPNEDIYYQANN